MTTAYVTPYWQFKFNQDVQTINEYVFDNGRENRDYIVLFRCMNSVLSLLVALSVAVCVSAGSYGGGQYLNYQQYVRPAYTQMQYYQPAYLKTSYVQPSYVGYGNTGSGLNLFNGSDAGSIIPIVIIFLLLAFFAPLLIGSLASSNAALWDSVDSVDYKK
uniref:Uncharacterized protein n=1 Tax=Magallana gigas TaxID=29159 RepID=K1QT71_MAGGI